MIDKHVKVTLIDKEDQTKQLTFHKSKSIIFVRRGEQNSTSALNFYNKAGAAVLLMSKGV